MAYADIHGTLLTVADIGGDGPPVLFWEGVGRGSRAGSYEELASPLGDVYRVIVAGPRDDHDHAATADPWAQARIAFGLLDAIGIERAVLVGADDTSEVVVRGALLHPDRVRGLVLLHADLPTMGVGAGSDRTAPAGADHFADRLDELAMPVLVVHGDADSTRPLPDAHAVANAVSDPRGVVEVAGGGPELATTHASEVGEALRDYLEGLPA